MRLKTSRITNFAPQVIYSLSEQQSLVKNFSILVFVMTRYLLSVFFILCVLAVSAQKVKTLEEDMPTENLQMHKDSNKAANKPKRKNYSLLYVPNADKILYGNPCVLEETHKMGFEYIVEPVNLPGSKSWKGKMLNNLWVKTKLVVTRSPFWKLILKKKIKKCREMSGDLVG